MGNHRIQPIRQGRDGGLALVGWLIGINIAIWVITLSMFRTNGTFLGVALLAYTLGLRHAFDVDHIAAIDNVVRQLVQKGRPTAAVGLFFSLGHSTVVLCLSLLTAFATQVAVARLPMLKSIGDIVGTTVSATFLIAIGLTNISILQRLFRQTGSAKGRQINNDNGPSRSPFLRLIPKISSAWQLFPIGFLFGLGFDTATEIGLLSLSAMETARGVPVTALLLLPILFACGMSILDTADSVMMQRAYGWANDNPARTRYYNLTITGLSTVIAIAIGAAELIGLAEHHQDLSAIEKGVVAMQTNSSILGVLVVVMFLLLWIGAALATRLRRT